MDVTTFWEPHPCGERIDDELRPYRVAARASQTFGYTGPSSATATEVYTKFVLTDMYAKAVQGMSPEQSVRWAAVELQKVHEA